MRGREIDSREQLRSMLEELEERIGPHLDQGAAYASGELHARSYWGREKQLAGLPIDRDRRSRLHRAYYKPGDLVGRGSAGGGNRAILA